MDKKLRETADLLIKRFKQKGIVVHRLDAFTTNSIYLKLDYGVANSIRISDHPGKKHLSYRYNIIKGLKKGYMIKDCSNGKVLHRMFYKLEDSEQLINDVTAEREKRIQCYGRNNYHWYMQKNSLKEGVVKGFWRNAKVV